MQVMPQRENDCRYTTRTDANEHDEKVMSDEEGCEEEGQSKRTDWNGFFEERHKRQGPVSAETQGHESVSNEDYPRLAAGTEASPGYGRATVQALLDSAAKLATDEADRLQQVAGVAGGTSDPQPGSVDRLGTVRLVLRGVAIVLGCLRKGR